MNNTLKSAGLLAIGLLLNGQSVAGLIDRGNGLIYDDILDITWLQDANYAHTSGYSTSNAIGSKDGIPLNIQADGKMGWQAAMNWAENLVFGSFDDWRLASIKPLNGSTFSNGANAKDGSADSGYNITSTQSELAYMFNINLGLESFFTTSDEKNDDWILYNDVMIPDTGLIQNLKGYGYWSNTEHPENINNAWMFATVDGRQDPAGKSSSHYAWAVRDGDIAGTPSVSVSEPASIALFGLSLLGLNLRFRRR